MKTKFRVFTALLLALMVLGFGAALAGCCRNRTERDCDPCGGGKHRRSRTFGKAHAYPFLHSVGVLSQRQVLYSALQCFAYGQPAHRPCECCTQPGLGIMRGTTQANFTVNQAAQATIPNTAIGTARRFRDIPEDRITHGAHILSAGAQDRRASLQASSATLPMHVRAATTEISKTLILTTVAVILRRLATWSFLTGPGMNTTGIMLKLL